MQLRPEQVPGYLQTHHGFLGPEWKEVQSFEDLEDEEDEYEYEETVSTFPFAVYSSRLLTAFHDRTTFQRSEMLIRVGRVRDPRSGRDGLSVPPNRSYLPAHRTFLPAFTQLGPCFRYAM